jgi:large subunit ribosomal protein L6
MSTSKLIKKVKMPVLGTLLFSKIKDKKFFILNTKTSTQKYIYIPSFVHFFKQDNLLIFNLKSSLDSTKVLVFNNLISSINIWFKGLEKPWKKKLILKGLGFKSSFDNTSKTLELKLGFSHIKNMIIKSKDISLIANKTKIVVEGFDKAEVGNFAHKIRTLKPSDAYKGKGFWYKNEIKTFKEVKKT